MLKSLIGRRRNLGSAIGAAPVKHYHVIFQFEIAGEIVFDAHGASFYLINAPASVAMKVMVMIFAGYLIALSATGKFHHF